MSHISKVKTALRESGLVATALGTLGYTGVEVHERPQRIRSPYGWSAEAEVIVRSKPNASVRHDFGFARAQDGSYELVIDSMQRNQHDEAWLARLSAAYSHAATLRYAEDNGYDVLTDEEARDGTRRMTLRRSTSVF